MSKEEKLIRLEEVAEKLDVTSRTIQRWVKQGMPVCKPGRFLYFYWPDVIEWMRENKHESHNADSG